MNPSSNNPVPATTVKSVWIPAEPAIEIVNISWGTKCMYCPKMVMSNTPNMSVCLDCYIERLKQLASDDTQDVILADYKRVMPRYEITFFADGSSLGNPGNSGAGVVIIAMNNGVELKRRLLSQPLGHATNNEAELKAAIYAAKTLTNDTAKQNVLVTGVCDSGYVVDGISQWIYKWMANGWRTAKKEPVGNQALWEALWDRCCDLNHRIQWVQTKGHSKDATQYARLNHIADGLAKVAAETQTGSDTAAPVR